MSRTVLYYNPGVTPDLCAIIHAELPPGWRLLTPPRGGDCSAELAACDYLLVADRAITAADLAAAPRLQMIQHQGVGYEKIDLHACEARRIPVGLTPDGTTNGVAEHTILLILALYKQLVTASTAAQAGRWLQWELRTTSFELAGKTLGVVGYGRIGREVARRAAAFDATVAWFDPFVSASVARTGRIAALEELLTESDIVSLHLPFNASTRHLIGARAFAAMKPGALLINTSRGGLVDEVALAAALDAGRLGGAGLDVLAEEPPAPNHPLFSRPNVLITPHISAGTRDAFATKMRAALANLIRHDRGEPLLNLVPELAALSHEAAAEVARADLS